MIKSVTTDEVGQFSELAKEFSRLAGRKSFDPKAFVDSWTNILACNLGHIYGRFIDGVPVETIGVLTYVDPFEGIPVASVAFWHLQSESNGLEGGYLFKEMIEDLDKRGIKRLFFSALLNERFTKVTGFLKAAGFMPVELQFMKEF